MGDPSRESEFFQMRVPRGQKQDWQDYADEEGFGSLAHLVRQSVNREISDNWVLESKTTVELDTTEIESQLETLNERIGIIEEALESIQTPKASAEIDRDLSREELIEVASSAHDVLPVVADSDQLVEMIEATDLPVEPSKRASITGAASDIADQIEWSTWQTRQALIWLETDQESADIDSTIYDGVRRWFVVDPTVEASSRPKVEDVDDSIEFRPGSEHQ